MSSAPPPLAPPIPQPERKGIPAIGWVGIGCGSLLIIFAIAGVILFFAGKRKYDELTRNPEKSVAEFIVQANPDLQKIRENDAKGTMTVRTKDGKEFTIRYQDIAQGKFQVEDADGAITKLGSSDLSGIPAWVPRLPGMSDDVTAFHGVEAGKAAGTYTGTIPGPRAPIEEFFHTEASRLGLNNSTSRNTSFGDSTNSIRTFSNSSREISLVISEPKSGPLQATVSFREK